MLFCTAKGYLLDEIKINHTHGIVSGESCLLYVPKIRKQKFVKCYIATSQLTNTDYTSKNQRRLHKQNAQEKIIFILKWGNLKSQNSTSQVTSITSAQPSCISLTHAF